MFVPGYYADPSQLHVGTLPTHAYFCPAERRMDVAGERREGSGRFQSLNGAWGFAWYASLYDLDEAVSADRAEGQPAFFEPGFDLARLGATIPVPSCWQREGYDADQYSSSCYPFPLDPPHIPHDVPCGVYVRDVVWEPDAAAPRAHLVFEGVDSCLYLWVNGRLAGYSEVSHATSEFDVTGLLVPGTNRVAVLVLKWCSGSYLEDQDKFRMSGIFRDVYLLARPERGVADYFAHATPRADGSALVTVDLAFLDGVAVPVEAELVDASGASVGVARAVPADACGLGGAGVAGGRAGAAGDDGAARDGDAAVAAGAGAEGDEAADAFPVQARLAFELPSARLWSPEDPYLYDLYLACEGEVICEQVGVREVTIEDGVVRLNGRPLKVHGVNRHDSDPETGFAISEAQFVRDLTLMRQHNVNAVRTSHYPNAPHLYALFDRLGLLVMDEADNESHGAIDYYLGDLPWTEARKWWNRLISDNPAWVAATLDRVRRCVERDKNRPCVWSWSMGNECGYGRTFERALAWTKRFDPSRLTHYEGAHHAYEERTFDFSNLDLYSRMYMPYDEAEAYFGEGSWEVAREGRFGGSDAADPTPGTGVAPTQGDRWAKAHGLPLVLCEFSHAMGNGPGDLEDYYELMQAHEGFVGGFVWEWCDHALLRGRTDGGRAVWAYGGDSGEWPDDGSFSCDGLVWPSRVPHAGLAEFKNVWRPARVEGVERVGAGVVLTLRSLLDFSGLDRLVRLSCELRVDGEVVRRADVGELVHVAPRGSVRVAVPGLLAAGVPERGVVTLVVRYLRREADAALPEALPAGYELGFDEVAVPGAGDGTNQRVAGLLARARKPGAAIEVTERPSALELAGVDATGTGWRLAFDRRTGAPARLAFGGVELLERPVAYSVWRAPTDNDAAVSQAWVEAGYDRAYGRADGVTWERVDDGSVRISCDVAIVAASRQRMAQVAAAWTVRPSGSVEVALDVERSPQVGALPRFEFPPLPRFGVTLELPRALGRVSYCGLGPNESYVDKRRSSWHGVFEGDVAGEYVPYVRPQECGSHDDCSWVRVSGVVAGAEGVAGGPTGAMAGAEGACGDAAACGPDGACPAAGSACASLTAVALPGGERAGLSFSALPYTAAELTRARHDHELVPSGTTVLSLDYAQAGIGSNSCGPRLKRAYQLAAGRFRFGFALIPSVG